MYHPMPYIRRPNDPGRAIEVASRWRDMPQLSEVYFYAIAIQELGNSYTFSLHFTPETRKRMERSSSSMKDYVAQRFRDHLPSVPFFLVLEFTPSGKLHAHGAVAVIGDPRAVKTGLMKVAGDARKIEHQAVRFFHNCKAVLVTEPTFAKQFSGRRGLFGWASYCGKNLVETTALLGGSPIARSLSVSKHARRIHADIVGM